MDGPQPIGGPKNLVKLILVNKIAASHVENRVANYWISMQVYLFLWSWLYWYPSIVNLILITS